MSRRREAKWSISPPGGHLNKLFRELREEMYETAPEKGAWFQAALSFASDGKFIFEFDHEGTVQFNTDCALSSFRTEKSTARPAIHPPEGGSSKSTPETTQMNETLELRTQIAQQVFNDLPKEGAKAEITIRIIGNYGEMEAMYAPERGGADIYLEAEDAWYRPFERLRKLRYEEVGAAWYTAVLHLTSQGDFKFQFDYEETTQFQHKPTAEEIASDLERFPPHATGGVKYHRPGTVLQSG